MEYERTPNGHIQAAMAQRAGRLLMREMHRESRAAQVVACCFGRHALVKTQSNALGA